MKTENSCNATNVAEKVLPAVVTISASGVSGAGSGSGVIIRSDGHILTNNHVISVAADGGTVEVVLANGSTLPASITGRDPKVDLAVLKVSSTMSLPVISMGSSGSVRVGAPVVVLGAPLGLSSTVTAGIVSALDRTVEVPSDNGTTALLISALQTDAAINPGNSGGALTNCDGALIGVPAANATVPNETGGSNGGSVGLGFAIPVDLAKAVADEIISTGTVTHSYFGLAVAPVPPTSGDPGKTAEGIYVTGVVPGGPSEAAGLRPGDIITEVDGEPVTDPNQIALLTLKKDPGDIASVTYVRGGQKATANVTLGIQP